MDVATILTNLRSLTLIGNTGAVADTAKLVNYLNMAYRRIYGRVVAEYPFYNQTTQNVSIVAGVGTPATKPLLILSLFDTATWCELKPTDVLAEEQCNPALDDEGSPNRYWMEGDAVHPYPTNSTTVRMRYVPDVEDLAADDDADAIIFPALFHDVLVWETALIIAYDERDKIVGAELAFTQDRAKEDWERLQSHLRLRAPRVEPKVKAPGLAY